MDSLNYDDSDAESETSSTSPSRLPSKSVVALAFSSGNSEAKRCRDADDGNEGMREDVTAHKKSVSEIHHYTTSSLSL
jgi:hypothetical protein